MTSVEVSNDGETWAPYKGEPEDALKIYPYVREHFRREERHVSNYRNGACATCKTPLQQRDGFGGWTPTKCGVCQSAIDRPTREELVGKTIEKIELVGEAHLALYFTDKTKLAIESAGYDEHILETEFTK